MKIFTKIFFLLALFIYSCSPKPAKLYLVREEIAAYYESGKYDKEVDDVVSDAIEEFKMIKVEDSAAVVFDVDETALSNYELMKEIDFGYVPEIWDKWIEKEKAPAIKEVRRLYDYLIEKKIKVIFLTGRKDYHYSPTFKNLKSAGYIIFDTLIVRDINEYTLPTVEYKSKKRDDLTAKGYKIIGTVGDQWSDLNGPHHGIQVKIPNYIYYIE